MDCYSCGAPLRPGMRSCPKCQLDFPLPVPGPGGQTEAYGPEGPPASVLRDIPKVGGFNLPSFGSVVSAFLFVAFIMRFFMVMHSFQRQALYNQNRHPSSSASLPASANTP